MSTYFVISDIHLVAEKEVKLSQSRKIKIQAVGDQTYVVLTAV